jgi:hypothetical protein
MSAGSAPTAASLGSNDNGPQFEERVSRASTRAIMNAEIGSETRHGTGQVRIREAVTVDAADVARAVALAWEAFLRAANDAAAWDMADAGIEARASVPKAPDRRLTGIITVRGGPRTRLPFLLVLPLHGDLRARGPRPELRHRGLDPVICARRHQAQGHSLNVRAEAALLLRRPPLDVDTPLLKASGQEPTPAQPRPRT